MRIEGSFMELGKMRNTLLALFVGCIMSGCCSWIYNPTREKWERYDPEKYQRCWEFRDGCYHIQKDGVHEDWAPTLVDRENVFLYHPEASLSNLWQVIDKAGFGARGAERWTLVGKNGEHHSFFPGGERDVLMQCCWDYQCYNFIIGAKNRVANASWFDWDLRGIELDKVPDCLYKRYYLRVAQERSVAEVCEFIRFIKRENPSVRIEIMLKPLHLRFGTLFGRTHIDDDIIEDD